MSSLWKVASDIDLKWVWFDEKIYLYKHKYMKNKFDNIFVKKKIGFYIDHEYDTTEGSKQLLAD